MKKRIAILFILIMVLTCMPVMAATAAADASETTEQTAAYQAAGTGWVKAGSNYRYYYAKGTYFKNSIHKIGGSFFGFNANGYLLKGFFTIKGQTYYGSKAFGPKGYGIIVNGYQKIGSYYYYFNPARYGAVAKGFVTIGKKLYYFDSEGRQRRTKGWFYVGNAMYYVQADGTIATNTTIDGYKIGPTGAVTDVYGMDKKAQGYSSNTRYMILVNKSRHLINVYQGSKGSWAGVRRNMPCTIGKSSTPSPSGTFRLSVKSSGAYGYKDFKASTAFYTTRISAGNFFHSILYKKGSRNPYTSKVKDGALGKNKSNSCIRMRLEDAKYIYQVTPRNSRVVVY